MEENKTVFTVGEKEYDVVKTGIGQAQQVANLSNWLSKHGSSVAKTLSLEGDSFSAENVLEIATALLGSLDTESMLSLFIIVFGCSRKEAEAHFDISLLLEGAVALFENQPSFKRIIDRFFSGHTSQPAMEESSTQ
jgi:hypothetical protein